MNCFIQPYIEGVQHEVRLPLYDPREVFWNRERFRRDCIEDVKKANSFYCPSGPEPARGWILVAREDYNRITSVYYPFFQLEIGDPTNPDNVQTLQRLCIVQARCVTRGLETDPNALYLLEITDRRGLLCNKWYQMGSSNDTGSSSGNIFNMRNPDYPDAFDPATIIAGVTPFTWTTMLDHVWESFDVTLNNTFVAATGGVLPYIPVDTPEGYWLDGYNLWLAFNDIIEELGIYIRYDPTKLSVSGNAQYKFVERGTADAALAALYTRFLPRLEDDYEWKDTGSGRIPDKIVFQFRARYDILSFYEAIVSAPANFPATNGVHFITPHYTVKIGDAPSEAEANTIAIERAAKYYQALATPSTTRIYAGALPFSTGSLVTSVRWYQDLASQDVNTAAWKTEVIYAPRLLSDCDPCCNNQLPKYAHIPQWDLPGDVVVADGDYGDVTVSSSGTVWTVTGGPGGMTEGNLAATGTNQATAALIVANRTRVTGADGTKGVILPNTTGGSYIVWNADTTNSVNVYPPSGARINGDVANAPIVQGAQAVNFFYRLNSTHWSYSAGQPTID